MRVKRALREVIVVLEIYGLLVEYIYLHILRACLIIKYRLLKAALKAAKAVLIEAVKIEYCIKSLSKEDRVIFAACVTVSIYALALVMIIRM